MRYALEDFRNWLVSFEGDDQPFQELCPIATWQQHNPDFKLYFESLSSEWMAKFIFAVDDEMKRRTDDLWDLDWSSFTVKEALSILDTLEVEVD